MFLIRELIRIELECYIILYIYICIISVSVYNEYMSWRLLHNYFRSDKAEAHRITVHWFSLLKKEMGGKKFCKLSSSLMFFFSCNKDSLNV